MIGRLILRLWWLLVDAVDEIKFRLSLPPLPYPLTLDECPELAKEFNRLTAQHLTLKKAKKKLRQHK